MKREDLLAMSRDGMAEGEEATEAATPELADLGQRLVAVKEELDELKDQKKAKQKEYDELRNEVLPQAMRLAGIVSEEGKGSFTLPDGSTIYLGNRLRSYVRKADRPKLNAWLRSQGHGDLIRETVHHQTLQAFCREQTERGEALPDFVSVYHETAARVRGG